MRKKVAIKSAKAKTKLPLSTPAKNGKISKGVKAAGPYFDVRSQPQPTRPRYFGSSYQDSWKLLDTSTRASMVNVCRELAAQLPNLSAGIDSICNWVVDDSWKPRFLGQDKDWGAIAEEWLWNDYANVVSVRGSAFNWKTIQTLLVKALIVDGDCLVQFIITQKGFRVIDIVPGHRIGNRWNDCNGNIIKEGAYAGFRLVDGVVLSESGRPLSYKILGDKPEDDYFISANNCKLIYNPATSTSYRGVPLLSSAIKDALHYDDTQTLTQRAIRTTAGMALIKYNKSGQAEFGDYDDGLDEETSSCPTSTNQECAPVFEEMAGGDILYAAMGEGDVKDFNSNKPSPNLIAHLEKLEAAIIASIGWNMELIQPTGQTGATPFQLQEFANKTIKTFQSIIFPICRTIMVFGVVGATELGIIPDNADGDWYKWDFDYPPQIVLYSALDRQADLADLRAGLITQRDINIKYGRNSVETMNQKQKEIEDLIARATDMSKSTGRSFDWCYNQLQNLGPNPLLVSEPKEGEKV